VTFWGSQWSKLNTLSGGAAPSSFKGFVNTIGVPTCTSVTNWQTDPGNSSNPPATVPGHITALVATSISKTGSVISGNSPKMVIIKTNPGYENNPARAGTGTVVSQACP
jgi:hypothetical protein